MGWTLNFFYKDYLVNVNAYQEILPHPELRPTIECYWQIRGKADGVFRPIFPDGCTDIILHFGDALLLRTSVTEVNPLRAFVVGNMTTPVYSGTRGAVDLMGIRFRAGGLACYVRVPLHQLTNQRVALADVFPDFIETEPLANRSLQERVEKLDNFFLARTSSVCAREPWQQSLQHLLMNPSASVDQLTHSYGISRRQLERKFNERVGLSPKQLAQVVRFRELCNALTKPACQNLFALAVDHDFTDHAHFTRFFKQYAGLTPSEYRAVIG